MDDALLVRRFERLGDLPGDGQRFVDRDRPARDALATGPLPRPAPSRARDATAFFEPVDAAMFGWFSDASTSASRWKRARRSWSAANDAGRILIATWRLSFVSVAR